MTDGWRAVPTELTTKIRWVCWQYEAHHGKRTKAPINARTGGHASSTNPATWGTFRGAVLAAPQYDGISFALTRPDGCVGLDLDHCRDAATGVLADWALAVLERFPTYAEVSPSGTGLHLVCQGAIAAGRKRGDTEVYNHGRFLTVTGARLTPWDVTPCQAALDWFVATYFPPLSEPPGGQATDPPVLADTAIWRICGRARNAAKYAGLMAGDWAGLGYPSQSEADLALLGIFAFYSGDRAQLERLFSGSKLADGKWRTRPDYRERSIAYVLRRQTRRFGRAWAA